MGVSRKMDLDVNSVVDVVPVLREAVDEFRASQAELSHYHQDALAGREWLIVASALEAAADRITRNLKKVKAPNGQSLYADLT